MRGLRLNPGHHQARLAASSSSPGEARLGRQEVEEEEVLGLRKQQPPQPPSLPRALPLLPVGRALAARQAGPRLGERLLLLLLSTQGLALAAAMAVLAPLLLAGLAVLRLWRTRSCWPW